MLLNMASCMHFIVLSTKRCGFYEVELFNILFKCINMLYIATSIKKIKPSRKISCNFLEYLKTVLTNSYCFSNIKSYKKIYCFFFVQKKNLFCAA